MSEIKRIDVGQRLSEVAIYNGVAYLAGQIPEDGKLDMYGQTKQVLAAIDTLLERVGSNKDRLLSVQIFISNMAEFDQMNKAWDEWVSKTDAPPRATVEARLANPDFKVEIVVVAAVK